MGHCTWRRRVGTTYEVCFWFAATAENDGTALGIVVEFVHENLFVVILVVHSFERSVANAATKKERTHLWS